MEMDTIKLFGEKISVPRNYGGYGRSIPTPPLSSSSSPPPLRTLLLLPMNPIRDSHPYISAVPATDQEDDDDDDVDTSLSLSSSLISGNKKRKSPKKPSRFVHVSNYSIMPPPPPLLSHEDDDDVDTSPVLSSSNHAVSSSVSGKKRAFSEIDDASSTFDHGLLHNGFVIYNPTPLRCYPPMSFPVSTPSQESVATQQESSNAVTRGRRTMKPRRQRDNNGGDYQNIPPLAENIPGMDPDNGTRPEFLYRKRLEDADVKKSQNRLFISKSAKGNVMRVLKEEERVAVNEAKNGLVLTAMDVKGKLYELQLKKWPSLDMLVLNKGWIKLVSQNKANKGDWVQLWGYRQQNGEFRLVVRFEEPENEGKIASCSSSSTNGGTTSTMLAN